MDKLNISETLFSLGDKYLQVLDKVEEAEGVLDDALAKELEEIESIIMTKSENYILVDETFDMKIAKLKEWSNRINTGIKTLQNNKQRLRDKLKDFMISVDTDVLENELGKIRLVETKKVSDDIDFEQLPSEYKDVKITVSPKKRDILKELKAGHEIPGAKLETNTNIRLYKVGKKDKLSK